MEKTKAMCRGCHDDFYNRTQPDGCWSFDKATIVERIKVGVWEPPPYAKSRAAECLSCYHEEGSAMLKVDDCRVKAGV